MLFCCHKSSRHNIYHIERYYPAVTRSLDGFPVLSCCIVLGVMNSSTLFCSGIISLLAKHICLGGFLFQQSMALN